MNRIRSTEVKEHIGQQVRLLGWLHAIRRLGGINFIVLRDGWGTIQAVTENESDLDPLQSQGLQPGSVIALQGLVEMLRGADEG